ncbi:hypothetical protein CHLNCDRAFT_136617, partial [Chlorella variabilis]
MPPRRRSQDSGLAAMAGPAADDGQAAQVPPAAAGGEGEQPPAPGGGGGDPQPPQEQQQGGEEAAEVVDEAAAAAAEEERRREEERVQAEEAGVMAEAARIRAVLSAFKVPPCPEPKRGKTHWDCLLEEMAWLAKEFSKERTWKLKSAKRYAHAAQRSNLDLESRVVVRAREEERAVRKRAAWIAKEPLELRLPNAVPWLLQRRVPFESVGLKRFLVQPEGMAAWEEQAVHRLALAAAAFAAPHSRPEEDVALLLGAAAGGGAAGSLIQALGFRPSPTALQA